MENLHNSQYGFQFQYPGDWQKLAPSSEESKAGLIVSFQTPDTDALIQKHELDPGSSKTLAVSYWKNINNEYAKGGSIINEPTYKNLADFLNGQDHFKQKVSEFKIDGLTAYRVNLGEAGINDGIMAEHNGIYQLSFPRIYQGKNSAGEPDNTADLIISTFKFTR